MTGTIYFDHNATTNLSQNVFNSLLKFEQVPLNPSSIHFYGRKARSIVESVREKVAEVLSVPKHFRIIFTGSATEANNIVLASAKKSGMNIFTAKTEHPSVLKADVSRHISVNGSGEVLLEDIVESGFYSIMLANNEIGTVQQIDDIVEKVKSVNGIIHIDAVQAIGKIRFSCSDIGANAYTISGHKFGGPQGVGVLIYDPDAIAVKPLLFGGGQERGVRPGTENVMAIYGLGLALEEIESRVTIMANKVRPIRDYIEEQLEKDAIFFGRDAKSRLPNTISLAMPGVRSEVQVVYFDSQGIAVSAGSACSAGRVDYPHVLMAIGSNYNDAISAIRVSLGIENTIDEAKVFIEYWHKLYNQHKNNC
jgi:cysteine desulfurase